MHTSKFPLDLWQIFGKGKYGAKNCSCPELTCLDCSALVISWGSCASCCKHNVVSVNRMLQYWPICIYTTRAEPGSCEERDPFLPGRGSRGGTLTSLGGPGYSRPRHSHTPPQTPPFPGTLWVLFIPLMSAATQRFEARLYYIVICKLHFTQHLFQKTTGKLCPIESQVNMLCCFAKTEITAATAPAMCPVSHRGVTWGLVLGMR